MEAVIPSPVQVAPQLPQSEEVEHSCPSGTHRSGSSAHATHLKSAPGPPSSALQNVPPVKPPRHKYGSPCPRHERQLGPSPPPRQSCRQLVFSPTSHCPFPQTHMSGVSGRAQAGWESRQAGRARHPQVPMSSEGFSGSGDITQLSVAHCPLLRHLLPIGSFGVGVGTVGSHVATGTEVAHDVAIVEFPKRTARHSGVRNPLVRCISKQSERVSEPLPVNMASNGTLPWSETDRNVTIERRMARADPTTTFRCRIVLGWMGWFWATFVMGRIGVCVSLGTGI